MTYAELLGYGDHEIVTDDMDSFNLDNESGEQEEGLQDIDWWAEPGHEHKPRR